MVGRRRLPGPGIVALLLAALLPCTAATAAADDADVIAPVPLLGGVLSQSRVLYPLRSGRWHAAGEQRYQPQALGVSVRYLDNRKPYWLDLFVYPAGRIDAAELARIAVRERDQIAAAAAQSGRAAQLETLSSVSIDGAGDVWELGLRYPDEGTASAMALFSRDMYLVKVRASVRDAVVDLPVLMPQVRDFISGIAPRLRIAHTGGCWLADRVVLVEGLAEDSAALAAAHADDGRLQALWWGDALKIDAASKDQAGNIVSAMSSALHPGCVAPEAIDLQVPEGMREIRIEYHDDAALERGGPPRTRRRGARTRIG